MFPSLVHKLNSYSKKDIVIYIIPVHDQAHPVLMQPKEPTNIISILLRMLSDRNTVGISINH
jgi:hypothetical protein